MTSLARIRNDLMKQFFDDWMDYINPISSFNYRYPNEYFCTIDVFQYSEWANPNSGNANPGNSQQGGPSIKDIAAAWKPNVVYQWQFQKAWPTLVNAQPVNWADQEVLRIQVSFAYKYWSRPTLANQTADNMDPSGDSTAGAGQLAGSVDYNTTA